MIPTGFTLEVADWNNETDRNACRAVREQVFIVEQQVPREEEWDNLDARSRHVLARDEAGNPIGTGRLTPEHKIGRMAVLAPWRGKRVGTAILDILLEQARALHYGAIEMHAQTNAVPFYERAGFARYGEEFLECDIRHFHMRKELEPVAAPERAALLPRPEVRSVKIQSSGQAQAETLRLLADTKRELCIYTRDLDPLLFDSELALEAFRQIGIRGRGANVRILIQDQQAPARCGHRLIGLAQRLTSVFAFRTPVEEVDQQYPSAFVLNDVRGFYFRVLGNRFEGEAVNYAPGRHVQLLEYFNQVWERSESCDELRQLTL